MKDLLSKLAQARLDYEAAREAKNAALDAFLSLPGNKEIVTAEGDAKIALQKADDELRQAALSQYVLDNEKKHDGYQIKEKTEVKILDEKAAFEWCLKNSTPDLMLDVKSFKKTIEAGKAPDELGTVKKVPAVYVDSDLERFLGE